MVVPKLKCWLQICYTLFLECVGEDKDKKHVISMMGRVAAGGSSIAISCVSYACVLRKSESACDIKQKYMRTLLMITANTSLHIDISNCVLDLYSILYLKLKKKRKL